MYDEDLYIPDRKTRQWAMFCHLGGLASFTWVPGAGIILPLILWLSKREDHPFIDRAGRDAINFQISASICYFVICVTVVVLKWLVIGWLVFWVPGLFLLIQAALAVMAGIRASEGRSYDYPIAIRFIN